MTGSRSSRLRLLLVVALPVAAVAFPTTWFLLRPTSTKALLEEARGALAASQPERAMRAAGEVLERDPRSSAAREIWAESAWDSGAREAAVRCLLEVPDDAPRAHVLLHQAGSLAVELGWVREAEDALRRALAIEPDHTDSHNKLAYLYGVEGRAGEMQRHLFAVLRQHEGSLHHLVMLGAGEPVARDDAFVQRCLAARPDDPLVLLGRTRTAVFEERAADALPTLRRIVARHPEIAEARARLGLALLDAEPDGLTDWRARLPAEARDHPDVQFVLARYHENGGRLVEAARRLARAVELDPDHRAANVQLARRLESLGRTEEARVLAERADRLRSLARAVDRAYTRRDGDAIRQAAELCLELDRTWEAHGWCRVALATNADRAWAAGLRDRLVETLASNPPRTIEPPRFTFDGEDTPRAPAHESDDRFDVVDSRIRFAEEAEARGIDFTFDTGHEPGLEAIRLHESFGGGVAALDFDRDGRPDLYFTQGGPLVDHGRRDERRPVDRLYRNHGADFEDVTTLAGLHVDDVGAGVAAGDVDGDGFPDLYVANLGRNRLLLNNGDGTFQDVTEFAGLSDREWTTSVAVADLDGDGLADLYDVDYLDFDAAPRTLCTPGAELTVCGPDRFPASRDRLHRNLGDGRFRDATGESGIDLPQGKGLGILVGNLDGAPGLDPFVANDGEPNFWFRNASAPGRPRFENSAYVAGLAVDRDGLAQACMGIAAGDATGNGRVDLFVTNFADQSNTLYVHDAGAFFADETRRADLREPGFGPLGFGTQFLDAEHDGWPDLVVANGHVYDLRDRGSEFHMRPQFLRNVGGRFVELAGPDLGPYFETKWLGRGLARLDWNGDGREDFAVSNISAPASLVTNESEPVGTWIAVRLVDTHGARDAVGTSVTVRAGEPAWRRTRQLLAGDGYQASNERQLVFGLPNRPDAVELVVVWPDGATAAFPGVATGRRWLVRRGDPVPLAIP